jgi:hypothetical protein
VDYQPISDPAQLQMLQELLHMVLYGTLLAMVVASVCLLGLCLSELRLPRRRPSIAKGREWRTSGDALPERERGQDRVPAADGEGRGAALSTAPRSAAVGEAQ